MNTKKSVSTGHKRNVERHYNSKTISYRIGPDLDSSPAITLFFDEYGGIPLLNSNLSITDVRLFLCLASICDPDTNVLSFKAKEKERIIYEMSKYGVNYVEDTLMQSKKKLVKEKFLARVVRNYVMINPSIMYYGGKKNVSEVRYKRKSKEKKLSIEKLRLERACQFRQLVDKNNVIGQQLTGKVLYHIYKENIESKFLSSI